MKEKSNSENPVGHKRIPLFDSPVDLKAPEGLSSGDDPHNETHPGTEDKLMFKHAREDGKEPTEMELFYDLFFAANYTVLSEIRSIRDEESLKSYIGYYSIIWLTWSLLTLYDVRYLTDCIFERVMRAVHLGVMVSLAVITPEYDPEKQNSRVFRSMAIPLVISRVALCIEYAYVLWCVWKYKRARHSLYMQIGVHAVAALIYLGVTFSFNASTKHSRGFIAWYIVPAAESLVTLAISNIRDALRLKNTHLMKRMSLITLIILGDGIVVLAKEVSTIVDAQHGKGNPWNALARRGVMAAAMCIYFVFLVYSDWKTHEHFKSSMRQQLWTILHFPFHLALTLFIQGFVQFVLWSKIFDVLDHLSVPLIVFDPAAVANATTMGVKNNLSVELDRFFEEYSPKYDVNLRATEQAMRDLSAINNSFWPQWSLIVNGSSDVQLSPTGKESLTTLSGVLNTFRDSILDNIFSIYAVDTTEDINNDNEDKGQILTDVRFQQEVLTATIKKYEFIFQYAFVAAACALASMTLLAVVSRTARWKVWPVTRISICFLLSIATGLLALLHKNSRAIRAYVMSAWPLPTLTLIWFTVLLAIYLGNAIVSLRHKYGYSRQRHDDSQP